MEGAPPPAEMELVFGGERCDDARQLKHYGVCENWIAQAREPPPARETPHARPLTRRWANPQVAGFVINPSAPGRKYVDGLLVPVATADPDWDAYPC